MRRARVCGRRGGDEDHRKLGPMPDQVAVVSLLLWACHAIGAAGFATVWEDGNNKATKAWGRRCRVRIQQFAQNEAAHRQARALRGDEYPMGSCSAGTGAGVH